MLPITILAVQKISDLLTANSALEQEITSIAAMNVSVPTIQSQQVVLSSAGNDIGDRDAQLTYPRICLYSEGFQNSRFEKFRAFSGQLHATVDIWASGNLVNDTDRWIHFYVEAVSKILRKSAGDWGDGVFFGGAYDVQFQPPKTGGIGFVQMARLRCNLTVNQD